MTAQKLKSNSFWELVTSLNRCFWFTNCRCDGIHFVKLVRSVLWRYQMILTACDRRHSPSASRMDFYIWLSCISGSPGRPFVAVNGRKPQKMSTTDNFSGGRLQRHKESRPTGNGTNEKTFLYNDYIYRSADSRRAPQEVSGGPKSTTTTTTTKAEWCIFTHPRKWFV